MPAGLVRGFTQHLRPFSPGVSTDPLDRGRVVDLRFDPAGKLVDYSGRGNHGGISATGATWVSSEVGSVIDSDPAGLPLITITDARLDNLDPMSWEFYFKPHINFTSGTMLINKANRVRQFVGSHSTAHQFLFRVDYDVDNVFAEWATPPGPNVWMHVICTWSTLDDIGRMYVDGNLEAQDGGTGTPNSDAGAFVLLARSSGFAEFDGELALFRVYNRIVTAGEALARSDLCHARATLRGSPSLWYMPWGKVAAVGGQPMQLRGTTVPHLRQWHPRVAS